MHRLRRAWRPVVLALVGGLTLALLAVLYRPGYERRVRMEASLLAAQVEHQRLAAERDALREQVQRLRDDPLTLEREARLQLGLVRPGEVIYKFPPEESPQVP